MRGIWVSKQDEERAFADKAAKHFAEHPEHLTFGGALTSGEHLALRWGLDNDCVVVLRISEDHEPVNYYELVRRHTDAKQLSFRTVIEQRNALLGVLERGRQKLATYVSVCPGDKELRGLLADWDSALAKARGES